MSIRPSKSSGRTSLAICSKSSGRADVLPSGTSCRRSATRSIAFASASSSVGGPGQVQLQDLRHRVGSLPASRAPSANFSNSPPIFSSGAPTVMRPSAYLPVFLAVTGPAVATRIGGGGRRASSTAGSISSLEELAGVLDVLARERGVEQLLMISMASNIRATARAPRASSRATTCSFSASPEPRPEPGAAGVHGLEGRRGLRHDRRVEAEASGRSRPGRGRRVVRSPIAVSTFHTNAAWPCCGHPRLEVVGGHAPAEPVLLGERRVADDLLRRRTARASPRSRS